MRGHLDTDAQARARTRNFCSRERCLNRSATAPDTVEFIDFPFLVVGPELWRYHIMPCGALGWYILFCIVCVRVR